MHSVSMSSELHVVDVTVPPQLIVPVHAGKQAASGAGGLGAVRSAQLAESIVL